MKIRLHIECGIEFVEEPSEEMRRSFELATARWEEILELSLTTALQQLQREHPDLQFVCGWDKDDEAY